MSINSNGSVLDTTTLDGAAVTNLLFARAEVARKLQFQKTEIKVSAPVAPVGQVVAVQPTVGQVVAVQPQWQPPPFVRTPEAAQIGMATPRGGGARGAAVVLYEARVA